MTSDRTSIVPVEAGLILLSGKGPSCSAVRCIRIAKSTQIGRPVTRIPLEPPWRWPCHRMAHGSSVDSVCMCQYEYLGSLGNQLQDRVTAVRVGGCVVGWTRLQERQTGYTDRSRQGNGEEMAFIVLMQVVGRYR